MIRLSTAHARARLSKSIDVVDAKAAVEMVQFSHFQKVLEKPGKRKRRIDDEDDEEDEDDEIEDEMDDDDENDVYALRFDDDDKKPRKSRHIDQDEPMDIGEQTTKLTTKIEISMTASPLTEMPDSRFKEFRQFLYKIFREHKLSSLNMDKIYKSCEEEAQNEGGKSKFSRAEIDFALAKMNDLNQIFISNDMVILI